MSDKVFNIAGTERWIEVVSVDLAESYEWDEAHVYYDPDHKVFRTASGSGCSCDWINDHYDSIGDFGETDRAGAIRFIQEYVDDSYRGRPEDRQNLADKIRQFKP